MVAIRPIALLLALTLIALSPSRSRTGAASATSEGDPISDPATSLFAQSAAEALDRDFPSRNISFLLLDATTGRVLTSRWDHPDTPIPMGSLFKPFTALAYGEQHEFQYPAHTCRGATTGCWLPRGHGKMNLTSAIANSCNSYFRVLTADLNSSDVAPTAARFGLRPPPRGVAGAQLAGLGNRWDTSPLSMARAYVELAHDPDQPAVNQILAGMAESVKYGTAAAVRRVLSSSDALAKTGTATCTHGHGSPGDGFAVILTPADHPGSSSSPVSTESRAPTPHKQAPRCCVESGINLMQTGRAFRENGYRDSPMVSRDGHPDKTRLLQLGFALICATLAALVLLPVHAPISAESHDTAPTIRIGVLGLFHPRQLTVTALPGQALVLHATHVEFVLEKSSGTDSATLRLDNDSVTLTAGRRTIRAASVTITGRNTDPVGLLLSVPQKLTRRYRGTVEVRPSSGSLLAIVTMDRETAVASVLAAETTADTPLEALKAEAIAIRSYFVAGRARHHEFDFCDTTHCQFLREPPPPASPVAKAVAATYGLVLAYDSQPFAAMYSRSCSGLTHTPAELHLLSSKYPYYSVECPHCRAHPVRWTTRVSAADGSHLNPLDEPARLNVVRRLGWASVPSNDFTKAKDGDSVILSGVGQGHGVGLCQSGAKAMAQHGATLQQILAQYYPNTAIVTWPI